MYNDHLGDDAELYAIGALEPDERVRVEAHLRNCPACTKAVAQTEELVRALESRLAPVPTPESLDRDVAALVRPRNALWIWGGVAAAFLVGLLWGTMFAPHPRPDAMRDRATIAMIESHFNHAQFAGPHAPDAKVIYARDRSWLFVIVADTRAYDVYAVNGKSVRRIGSTQPMSATSEAYIVKPGALDALQLRIGDAIVGEAKVR